MANAFIYIVCLWFLIEAGRSLWFREEIRHGYTRFVRLLLPGAILIAGAFWLGMVRLPRESVVIHGHRIELQSNRNTVYLGSDPEDDIVFRYRARETATIEPNLVELRIAAGDKQVTVTQTDTSSPNIVSIDGKPLRALPLEVGKTHKITFGLFNYSDNPKNILELEIPAHRDVFGVVQFAQPEFRFRGQVFQEGFSTGIGWVFSRWLPSIAPANGRARHLAWNNRVAHRALNDDGGNVLRQASIARFGNRYWLFANDADIRLDGQVFPSSREVTGSARLRIESRQLGAGRWSVDYRLLAPADSGEPLYLAFPPGEQRVIALPDVAEADRLCLTRSPSVYSGAYDVLDGQFPRAGMLISREGSRFLFRGELLRKGERYTAGQTVFSIERTNRGDAWLLALLALLFYASALFVPSGLLDRLPIVGVVLGTALFLHAVRLVLAFRAWLGPPFNDAVFLDSVAAPYFFVLFVVVLITRQSPLGEGIRVWVLIWNFFVPGRRRMLQPARDREGGLAVLITIAFGLILYALFGSLLGSDFLLVIGFFFVLSLAMGWLSRWEENIGMRPLARGLVDRYAPLLSLVVLMALAMLAAPFLGGREIVPFLPGRLRPDIFIQLALLMIVAYQAGLWERDRQRRVIALFAILGVFVAVTVLPLAQGVLARDLGFFVVVFLPLMAILMVSAWNLDVRLKGLFAMALLGLVLAPFLFRAVPPSLDKVWAQRVAFWVDRPRLRAEQFFKYQAQVPIQWSAAQGTFGGGYFEGDWYPALASTSVNDNVAAIFINGELGGVGSVFIMSIYALLFLGMLFFLHDFKHMSGGFKAWVIFGAALMVIWAAAAMFLQNFGYIPLTGKNLPLLGLDSKNDVLRYGLLLGLSVRYMRSLSG